MISHENSRQILKEIQDRLFTIGSELACDPAKESKMKLPDLHEKDIQLLEVQIDEMEKQLPPMKHFILPGGHAIVSTLHIARCVCRRAERCCVRIQTTPPANEDFILKYLNRLSDYLFVLSRYQAQLLKVEENPWLPRL